MIERPEIDNQLRAALQRSPAVVLLGPRQVGKTTLARAIAAGRADQALYLDLEQPADRRRLEDADDYLRAQQGQLVILDEIHRAPHVFESLRGIIDDRRAGGQGWEFPAAGVRIARFDAPGIRDIGWPCFLSGAEPDPDR